MSNDFDSIIVFNPDTEPMQAVYNSEIYDIVKPNGTGRLPRFVAKLFVKHLIDRLIQKNHPNKTILDPTLRKMYANQIVREQQIFKEPKPLKEYEKLLEEDIRHVDDMQRVENIPEHIANVEEVGFEPTAVIAQKPPETPMIDSDVPEVQTTPQSKYPVNPSRTQILDYASNVSMMNLSDDKTATAVAQMSDEELKKEVGYEPDAI